jgi:hypothetical protein
MGLFGGKKQSYEVGELLAMSDSEINKRLKGHKDVPYRTAKELRKAAKNDRRAFEGEKGVGALLAGLKGGGRKGYEVPKHPGTGGRNYDLIPLKDKMHPAAYKQLLEREAKKQGLL